MASSSEELATDHYPSAVNVANFVSIRPWLKDKEKTTNFKLWKEQMLCLLESQGLLGFVDGKIGAPSPPEHDRWRRTDRLVKGWILGSIGEDALKDVVGLDSSRDVWLKLDEIFNKPTGQEASPAPQVEQEKGWNEYLPLYRAALTGNWNRAKEIFDQDQNDTKARLAFTLETALHIAVGTGKAIEMVSKLVGLMSNEEIGLLDELGYNALHVAALTGNTLAAKILVGKFPDLLHVPSNFGTFPVHLAALSAHRDTLLYLISQIKDEVLPSPYVGEMGVLLLSDLVASDMFDVALYLAEKFPDLSRITRTGGDSPLSRIALKDSAFSSGTNFNFWERFIYSSSEIPSNIRLTTTQNGNIEPQAYETHIHSGWHGAYNLIEQLVPRVKAIRRRRKLVHYQAIELVKCLCKNMESLEHKKASSIYRGALIPAARLGIHEIIEVIVGTFPAAIYSREFSTKQNMFHIAVQNRNEKVFNLIYQTSGHKHQYLNRVDAAGDTILHLAAKLAPPHKLNSVSGAALQMQREMQWFKEVEKNIHPYCRERLNKKQKTPKMIFTEEHAKLKTEGEQWMKDTANSCTIAATLIATVVFAAAITVPGGNDASGHPFFSKQLAFIIFAVTDAISLFTSATSLLMFLSIMTSRYAEEDFLYALPKRLIIGLITLFLSITFMMGAFGATLYLVFGNKKALTLAAVCVLACLPVTSFALLQFPRLMDVIFSTYGRGIFRKQSNRPFY